ncbi:MAG: EVE domain-containing protein [Planctomycetota bacterium]|nr:EVE domain-containing protein [Planctomycetota bacterium]
MGSKRRFWLIKSEPGSYSIADLERDGRTSWDGVRNYQARNFMRDEMAGGDLLLFYHSSTEPTGVAGIGRVFGPAYPDYTAWDANDKHYDPRASKENPVWVMVDVEFVEEFPAVVRLAEMKAAGELDGMLVLKRGQRLSIQPVDEAHFKAVRKMGKRG